MFTTIKNREKGLIYPSTLSFGTDIPLVIKVAHICPYRYTSSSQGFVDADLGWDVDSSKSTSG